MTVRVLGVDGVKARWVAVELVDGNFELRLGRVRPRRRLDATAAIVAAARTSHGAGWMLATASTVVGDSSLRRAFP